MKKRCFWRPIFYSPPNLQELLKITPLIISSDLQNDGEEGGCECESCQERSALVAEMAEETKKLQQCWIQLKQVKSYSIESEQIYKILTIHKPSLWSYTKGPDRFSLYDVYWVLTIRQTDKQSTYILGCAHLLFQL